MIDHDSNILEQLDVEKKDYDAVIKPPNRERVWKKVSGALALSYFLTSAQPGASTGFFTAAKVTILAAVGIVTAGLGYMWVNQDDPQKPEPAMVITDNDDKASNTYVVETFVGDDINIEEQVQDDSVKSRQPYKRRKPQLKKTRDDNIVPDLSQESLDVEPLPEKLKPTEVYARGLKAFKQKKYETAQRYFEEYEDRFQSGALIAETKLYLLDISTRLHYPKSVIHYAQQILRRAALKHRHKDTFINYMTAAAEMNGCEAAQSWLKQSNIQYEKFGRHACRSNFE